MIRINIRLVHNPRSSLLLMGTFIVSFLLFNVTAASERRQSATDFVPGSSGRHFYLTAADHSPDEALAACASGYRMASLWEMLDVSNLTYDADHPDAYIQDDSGSGPPSGWNGWVRTGRNTSGSNSAGSGNCLTWTSRDSSHYGTAVQLSSAWESAPGEIGAWNAGAYQCSLSGPVWCVGEFYQVTLPVILKE